MFYVLNNTWGKKSCHTVSRPKNLVSKIPDMVWEWNRNFNSRNQHLVLTYLTFNRDREKILFQERSPCISPAPINVLSLAHPGHKWKQMGSYRVPPLYSFQNTDRPRWIFITEDTWLYALYHCFWTLSQFSVQLALIERLHRWFLMSFISKRSSDFFKFFKNCDICLETCS